MRSSPYAAVREAAAPREEVLDGRVVRAGQRCRRGVVAAAGLQHERQRGEALLVDRAEVQRAPRGEVERRRGLLVCALRVGERALDR